LDAFPALRAGNQGIRLFDELNPRFQGYALAVLDRLLQLQRKPD
jgi:hypothetical protein